MASDRPPQSRSDVARYYDANTARFLRRGHGRKAGAIHRAVWTQRAQTREEAMHGVDARILREVHRLRAASVLDLGCGVGGSMLYLAERCAVRLHGITLSGVQADIGERFFREAGIADRCRIQRGDFLDPQTYRLWNERSRPPRLAYAVESFTHARDASSFFRAVTAALAPGDGLVLCDDFLTPRARTILVNPGRRSDAGPGESESARSARLRRRARRRLEEHRTGWHAHNRVTPDEARGLAGGFGFRLRGAVDLTPHLELDRPRDLFIRAVVALGRRLPIRGSAWENMLGGNALQLCLKADLMRYLMLFFEKTEAPQHTVR